MLTRLCATVGLALAFIAPSAAQTISIGTSPVGSSNHALGNALGKVLNDEAGIRARVVPYGGGEQFLPLINTGELEMAIPSASDAVFAYKGTSDFEGKPNPNLRAIATMFPYYVGWYVRKDAPYKTLNDLKGKKVAVGYTANSAQQRVYEAAFAAAGVTPSDFNAVPVPHVVRAADDFMQGSVESATFAIGAGKMAEVDTKVGGIRWLEITNTPEALARLKTVMPSAYLAKLDPGPALTGILEPTTVIFEDYLSMTGKHVSDEVAYNVARILYEHQDKLAGIVKVYARYDKSELSRDHGVPFHPGAIKYYTERNIWPAKS